MTIATLCNDCRNLMENGFRIKEYTMQNAKTKQETKCQRCGYRNKNRLGRYTLEAKKK